LIGGDFCWAPVYGKISIAAEYIMHFDTYLMVGVGGVMGEQTGDSSFAFAGSFGAGVRVFFNRTLALKLELKDYMVFDTVTFKTVEESDVQHQFLFNIGLSIFLFGADEEE
jgi:outer membrane beta-barrel protein